MTKDDATKLIRSLAAQNGGSISFDAFCKRTGIPQQRLRREAWFPGWNQLLLELGIQTGTFIVARTPDEEVAAAVADLIQRLGRYPTEDECAREKKTNPSFPNTAVIRRIKKTGTLWRILSRWRPDDDSYSEVRALAEKQLHENPASHDDIDQSVRVRGYVYMMRYGKKYKIGFTNSPVRRFREVRIELPDETFHVHSIETDDPKGIEAYWHRRFSEKRIRDSEWFELDADDVRAFKRRKYQ